MLKFSIAQIESRYLFITVSYNDLSPKSFVKYSGNCDKFSIYDQNFQFYYLLAFAEKK